MGPLLHLEEDGVRSILDKVGSDTNKCLECEDREPVVRTEPS